MDPNDFLPFLSFLTFSSSLFCFSYDSTLFPSAHFLSFPPFLLSIFPSLLPFLFLSGTSQKTFHVDEQVHLVAGPNSSLTCGHFTSLESIQTGNKVNKQVMDIIYPFIFSIMNLAFKSAHNLRPDYFISLVLHMFDLSVFGFPGLSFPYFYLLCLLHSTDPSGFSSHFPPF